MTAALQRPLLGELLPACPADLAVIEPRHLVLDSRRVSPGDVFLALPGLAGDGRDFIHEAFDRGAIAALAEADELRSDDARVVPVANLSRLVPQLARDFYGHPSERMALVAVTGTNGKTSVVDFVGQILRGLGVAAGCLGTLGARLDNGVTAAANTTPDVVSINRQLDEWLARGVDHVAMEASSHALDQGRLTGLALHTAVFTNLSRDHLDYHGDEQAYADAKLRLFRDFELKRAIFNADDPVARRVRGIATCPAMGISLEDPEADVYVQLLASAPLQLRIHTPLGTHTLSANLSGAFNAFNLAAAMMTVASMGYAFADVVTAAERVVPVAGRMQVVPNDLGIRVVIDYAHTPDALARALSALRGETAGELWVVFGCGGDRDRGKRELMGEEASRGADRVVVTSDNPRSEDPVAIVNDVLRGAGSTATAIIDRANAIRFALSSAKLGDTVLVAGKGHEDYQEIAGKRFPFSDQQIAADWLSLRAPKGEAL